MPGPYSNDLRKRAIDEVGSGASRREAAEQFGVSPSAVIKWVRRWCDTGSDGQAERRQRIATGKICAMVFRPDCCTTRFDAG